MDNGLDHTNSFRRLSHGHMPEEDTDGWVAQYRERLKHESQSDAERHAAMLAVNPAYIPRNHRVEAALAAAIETDDYAPFEELLAVLAEPFEERPEYAAYADPPSEDEARNFRTY
jgi:uncharacterized protein YdiU (UPF0061 family)